ncbi:MAG: adenine phosphoribosyltransferase [bacterium]
MNLKDFIKDVPDYPKQGIIFRDITPLLGDKDAFKFAVDWFVAEASSPSVIPAIRPRAHGRGAKAGIQANDNKKIDIVVGIDARGFLLASAVAYKLGAGLAIVRKPGKLPRKTIREDYTLEYASNTLEMHEDAIRPGQNVLIIDDVLATGGTMEATCKMVSRLGGKIVCVLFLIELESLQGITKLEEYDARSQIKY